MEVLQLPAGVGDDAAESRGVGCLRAWSGTDAVAGASHRYKNGTVAAVGGCGHSEHGLGWVTQFSKL